MSDKTALIYSFRNVCVRIYLITPIILFIVAILKKLYNNVCPTFISVAEMNRQHHRKEKEVDLGLWV